MIEIARYNAGDERQWDAAVEASRNGTFLHRRAFMDYHSDRFTDHSLLALDGERVLAVLPACERDGMLLSHGGLTYGGWLMATRGVDAAVMVDVVAAMQDYMRQHGLKQLLYKAVPHIYHRYPAEEDLYALHAAGAQLVECNISTTIDLRDPVGLDRGNRRGVNVARREGVVIAESDQWDEYWPLLGRVLAERHGAQPVHSVDEIKLLHSRFPHNIVLYTATRQGEMLAGVVMFFMPGTVAHAQYIAASDEGRRTHALTLLFAYLIDDCLERSFRYFDFGISNEDHGRYLNRGLVEQKSRLGGRGITYNTYNLTI